MGLAPTSVGTAETALGGRRTRTVVAHDAGGIAGHDRQRRDVAGDHGARADHRLFADGEPRENGGVGADRRAAPDEGAGVVVGMLPAARKRIVGEGGVRADEDVVLERDSVPDLDAAFDGDAISDAHVVLNEGLIANIAGGADHSAGQDVGVRPDARSRAHRRGFDDGGFVFEKRSRQPTRASCARVCSAAATADYFAVFELGIAGQGQDFSRRLFGGRQSAALGSARRLLKMIGNGVVDVGGDAALFQRGAHLVARRGADDVEMGDVVFRRNPADIRRAGRQGRRNRVAAISRRRAFQPSRCGSLARSMAACISSMRLLRPYSAH